MDELTRERYLLGVPWAERHRKPTPWPKQPKPLRADAAVIAERRRVLLGEQRRVRSDPGITVAS